MVLIKGKSEQYIESKSDIIAYLDQLKYALMQKTTRIQLQEIRRVDEDRNERYTNRYTIANLFPDQDKVQVLKIEAGSLSIEEYIETVKDINFPNRSDMRVFGRKYNDEEVYIKLRVEIIPNTNIFIMSFHYSTVSFKNIVFPYKK